MGDGLMVVFGSASDALACAIAMQTAVAGHAIAGAPALHKRGNCSSNACAGSDNCTDR